jgi:phosphoserine phosphatase
MPIEEASPLTEYETLALRISLLEGSTKEQFDALRAEVREGNANVAELVELFKGAKQVVAFASTAGAITIKFSAFILAISAMIAVIKVWLIGGKP